MSVGDLALWPRYTVHRHGIELGVANMAFVRFGHVEDRVGDIVDDTFGWGLRRLVDVARPVRDCSPAAPEHLSHLVLTGRRLPVPRILGSLNLQTSTTVILFALVGSATTSQADSTWTDHYRAARGAYESGDFARSRDGMAKVRTFIGEQPGVAYHLARAEARLGQTREALALLARYAASGMVRDPAADSAFVSLFADTSFQRLAAVAHGNGRAIGDSRLLHRFSANDLLIEDVTRDPRSGEYYATSVTTGGVLRFRPGGPEKRIAALETPGAATFAIGIDPVRRWLWVSAAATPTAHGYAIADSGRSWLTAYDLGSNKIMRTLEVPRDGRAHVLGDLAVTAKGEVFVTDSRQGSLYRVAPGGVTLDPLVPAEGLAGAQSPAPASDGRRVYIAQYGLGLAVVDATSGKVRRVTFEPGIAVQGIDGLYALDARTLLGVQNGVNPQRLVLLTLDAGGEHVVGWRALEQGTAGFLEPNHGVVVGKEFHFLNASGWDRVGADEQLAKDAKASPPELRSATVR